jgi:hypothetical protein
MEQISRRMERKIWRSSASSTVPGTLATRSFSFSELVVENSIAPGAKPGVIATEKFTTHAEHAASAHWQVNA